VLPVSLSRPGRLAVLFAVTHDAGRTWTARTRPVDARLKARPFAAIAGPRTWWVADAAGRRVSVTSDGGASWRAVVAHGLPRVARGELMASDARHAWFTTQGATPAAFTTDDGGRTWRPLQLPAR
jgi:photosystem II stability/assembly factor-like uncharacterized protein